MSGRRLRRLESAGILALGGVLLTLAGVAAAQQPNDASATPARRYSLEFILFEYDDSVSAGTEIFVPEYEDPFGAAAGGGMPGSGNEMDPRDPRNVGDTESTVRDGANVYGDTALPDEVEVLSPERLNFRLLPPESRQMSGIHDKLQLLDAYRPVLWSGWTQNVVPAAESPAIDLRRLGNLPADIDGELTLYLGRFVHIVVDIEKSRAAPAPERRSRFGSSSNEARIVYRIEEDRIMRNGDLRYFDHPKMGMVALLTVIE